uniref:Uncharacterized protein n=1 Tax=Neobodo designis TaxID=312471 RepID=A0A7S1LA28_NEODS
MSDAVESSAVYDPNRPEDAGPADAAEDNNAAYSPREGDDDAAAAEDDGAAAAADGDPLTVSRSGAANLTNPLSEPSSKVGSRAQSRVSGAGDEDANRMSRRQSKASRRQSGSASGAAPAGDVEGSGSVQPAASQSGAAPLRRGTMMGSMRRSSSMRRDSTKQPQALGGKRNTLASMMLSGKFTRDDDGKPPAAGGGFGDLGAEVASDDDGDDYGHMEDGEGDEIYGDTAEKLESEQIFMPNMRREPYIPVRIARDKLKQVLGEMAQMKHMHYAALETMERQQEFLKAQLEATVAAYARKLTNDYNGRVKALEAEYQRRLEGLNKTAMGDLQATLEAAQRETRNVEARAQKQIQEKEAEVEQERKMFTQKVQMARQAAEEAEKEAEAAKAQVADRDKEIDRLNVELRVAQATSGGAPSVDGGGGGGDNSALHEKIARLETEVAELKKERDQQREDIAAYEHAVDERDQEIAALQDQLAQLAEGGGGGEMVVGGDDDGEDDEEEGGVVVAGDDDEDEEEGGVVVA